jgi:hypothetical protein
MLPPERLIGPIGWEYLDIGPRKKIAQTVPNRITDALAVYSYSPDIVVTGEVHDLAVLALPVIAVNL